MAPGSQRGGHHDHASRLLADGITKSELGHLSAAVVAFDAALRRLSPRRAEAALRKPIGGCSVQHGVLLLREGRLVEELTFAAQHNLGFMRYLAGDLPRALELMPTVEETRSDRYRGVVGIDRAKVLLGAGPPPRPTRVWSRRVPAGTHQARAPTRPLRVREGAAGPGGSSPAGSRRSEPEPERRWVTLCLAALEHSRTVAACWRGSANTRSVRAPVPVGQSYHDLSSLTRPERVGRSPWRRRAGSSPSTRDARLLQF